MRILIFTVLALSLVSCAKTPMYISTYNGDRDYSQSTFYDQENKIRWSVNNTKDLLFIRLEFEDPLIQMKIAKNGMRLYLDAKGKKKRDFWVHYPIPKKPDMNKIRTRMKNNEPDKAFERMDRPMEIVLPPDARIYKYGQEIALKVADVNKYLDIAMKAENGEMTYELTLPLAYLKNDKIKTVEELSIGLVSEFELPKIQTPAGSGDKMQARGGKGGGSGRGGMRGGRGSASGVRGGKGVGSRSQMNSLPQGELHKAFSVWYKVKLAKN